MSLISPNYTDSYFAPFESQGYITGPPGQTTNALVKWSAFENEVDNSTVLLNSFGQLSQMTAMTMEPVASQPTDPNSIWVKSSDNHLYFDNTDLTAAASGDVVAPGTQTANTVPTWAGSGNALLDGTVTIDGSANISNTNSISLVPSVTNPGGSNTLWEDSNTHLNYGGAKLVEGPTTSNVLAVPTFSTSNGVVIQDSGYKLTNADSGQSFLFANDASNLDNAAGCETSTIIGNAVSNGGTPLNPINDCIVIGTQTGNGIGLLNLGTGTNVVIGNYSMQNDGISNVCLGFNNIGVGGHTGLVNGNICIGNDAGSVLTASDNILIGISAGRLLSDSSSNFNICLGVGAGDSFTVGSSNILMGNQTMTSNSTTSSFVNNIIIGNQSGGSSMTIAANNVVLGNNSLPLATSAQKNIVIGSGVGPNVTTGIDNILIGDPSGVGTGLTTGNYNLVLNGNVSDNSNNNIIIGNANYLKTYVFGVVGNVITGTGTSYVTIDNSTNQLGEATTLLNDPIIKELYDDVQVLKKGSYLGDSLIKNIEQESLSELKDTVKLVQLEIETLKKKIECMSKIQAQLFKRLGTGGTG